MERFHQNPEREGSRAFEGLKTKILIIEATVRGAQFQKFIYKKRFVREHCTTEKFGKS